MELNPAPEVLADVEVTPGDSVEVEWPNADPAGGLTPRGAYDFVDFRNSTNLFIDKSIFIKDFINGDKVQVIMRPRRFGKSLNLSMLGYFFSCHVEEDVQRKLFDDLEIWKHEDIIKEHMRQYSVVTINFRNMQVETWKEMLESIGSVLTETIKPFWKDIRLEMADLCDSHPGEGPGKFIRSISPRKLTWFLDNLVSSLFEVYHKRVIVLVDEYDAPLNVGLDTESDDRKARETFFSAFYQTALKFNTKIERTCLMGIVEIGGSNILSGLNNLVPYSIVDDLHSKSFGFTEDEIIQFLKTAYRLSTEEAGKLWNGTDGIQDWYNGYHIGKALVVNPWSFMNSASKKKFSSYWCKTTESLFAFCQSEPGFADSVVDSFRELLTQPVDAKSKYRWIPVAEFESAIKSSLFPVWTKTKVLHFLCMAGYLTYRPSKRIGGEVSIPNKELYREWQLCLAQSSGVAGLTEFTASYRGLINSFASFDVELIRRELMKTFKSLKTKVHKRENVFQTFLAGTCDRLGESPGWNVMSERGAGDGFADMIIDNHIEKYTIVFEFKVLDKTQQTKHDRLALTALKQIRTRQYYRATNERHKILAIGCVFGTGDPSGQVRVTMRTASLAPGKTDDRDAEFTRLILEPDGQISE